MEEKPAFANFLKTSSEPLSKLHVIGLSLLLITIIVFGAITEYRSAFLKMRRTDIGPYLRAAWSVRTGGDMYKITDDQGWHYTYPPLFAILMTPLADPPHGEDRTGYLPYEVTVGHGNYKPKPHSNFVRQISCPIFSMGSVCQWSHKDGE